MDSLAAYRQSLAEALRTRSLIPVIGPEMRQVQAPDTDRPQPFYQLVADQLLKAYGCTLPELPGEPGWQLHRAVLRILRGGASTARVRRSVAVTVREVAARVEPSATLKRLAALDTFDLFICLTPDDLLVKALGARSGGPNLSINAYAPSGDSSRTVDLAAATPGETRVFFPLGRAEAGDTATLRGDRSRCTTPRACAYAIACATCSTARTSAAASRSPSTTSASVRPCTNRIA